MARRTDRPDGAIDESEQRVKRGAEETEMPGSRLRPVSRVVTLDPRGRILLFDTELAYTRVWMTPGGALEQGESYRDAAIRELHEETGFEAASLSSCVWTVQFRFEYQGITYDQRERYFVTHVESSEVTSANWELSEHDQVREYRWWSLPELEDSAAAFRPANLVELLPGVLSGQLDTGPIAAPVETSARVC